MQAVKYEDCEPLAGEIIDLIKSQPSHIAIGALLLAVGCYGDTLPHHRGPLGRALLILGGRLLHTPCPSTAALEHMQAHPTIN